jgi:mono/diheme cytochrome c family protein
MKVLLIIIGFLTIVVGIVAAGFFFLGFYNVAAAIDDPAIVAWALPKVRDASINHFSAGLSPPVSLDDQAVIQAGARAYAKAGCVNCHGGPGTPWAKFSEGLHPDPPDLKDVAGDEPRQIFWVIKNGINMTGMPSFQKAGVSDQDIWSIVAFVKKIGSIKPEDYKAWTAAP